MKRCFAVVLLVSVMSSACAFKGKYTGKRDAVTAADGQPAWKCWYTFAAGDYFGLIFKESCPEEVDLR